MYINLIALQRAEQRKLRTLVSLLTKLCLAAFVVIALYLVSGQLAIGGLAREKANVDSEVVRFTQRAQTVKGLKTRQAQLKPTVDLLHKTQVTINRWRTVVSEVSYSLPPKVWIGSISPKFDGTNDSVALEAYSEDPPGVRETLSRLNRSPFVARADLTGAEIPARDPLTGKLSNPISFAVKADLKAVSVAAQ
ncbi:MAG TPA: hypothetical protein VGN26_20415 [Armatimonadota bacterium]|jgi:Tfp pilus assembly protein PilN